MVFEYYSNIRRKMFEYNDSFIDIQAAEKFPRIFCHGNPKIKQHEESGKKAGGKINIKDINKKI